jgi:hypothetical protein
MRSMLLGMGLLLVGCAGEAHYADAVPAVGSFEPAPEPRDVDPLAPPVIGPAVDAAIAAWVEAGLPIPDENCGALSLVAVRAPSVEAFHTGRYCSRAVPGVHVACYRPFQSELVFAPGAQLDGRGEPAIDLTLKGLAKCAGMDHENPPADVAAAAHDMLAQ